MFYIVNVGVNCWVMKVKYLFVEMMLFLVIMYGKYLCNIFCQDLKNCLCRKNYSYGVIC